MKNYIFRIVSLFFILLCPSFLYAGKDKVITIVPASRADSNAPNRAPALIPITAYYDSVSDAILVCFNRDLGEVTLTVINESTGEVYVDTIEAYCSPVSISISDSEGWYYLEFELESGIQYVGEFETY